MMRFPIPARALFRSTLRSPRARGTALAMLTLVFAPLVQADTAADFLARYTDEARRAQPQFAASAQRGAAFYAREFAVSKDFPACSTCHTANPAAEGRHTVTGKRIAPLAPAANAERFTEAAKVERWFKRNCTEVVGRECSVAEKADFIAFVKDR